VPILLFFAAVVGILLLFGVLIRLADWIAARMDEF
jgi:hypothetical protein